MADEQVKENVKNSSAWLRLAYMVLFAVLYSVAEVVLTVVVVFQFLSVLITGEKNGKVLALGAQLSTYAYQVFSYLTYNSETQPFPFGDWPSGNSLSEAVEKPTAKAAGPTGRGRPRKAAAKAEAATPEASETPDKPEA